MQEEDPWNFRESRGVSGQLLQAAADQIRAEGKRARATCSYAEIWFERHPEEADLLCP